MGLTLPVPAAWGMGGERPQPGPAWEKEDRTVWGEPLKNDNIEHHQFLSSDRDEALC